MKGKTLTGLLAGGLLTTGCATSAVTNTTPINTGSQDYAFRQVETDEVYIEGRGFDLVPRDDRYSVVAGGIEISVLDNQLVPRDNSKRLRTPDRFTVVPTGEKYFLANAYHREGGLILNKDGPKEKAFFVLSKKVFPSSIASTELEDIQERTYERMNVSAPYGEFEGKQFRSVPMQNPFGPNKVFIDLREATPLYIEESKLGENGEETVEVKFGFVATGYLPISGEEVLEEEPREEESELIKVLEVASDPFRN